MSNLKECPSCGSAISKEFSEEKKIKIDSFQEFCVKSSWVVCDICGFEGDDETSNSDFLIEEIRKISDHQTLTKLIDEVTDRKVKAAFIERAFKLPPRTLNRWKSQKGSSSSLALMKLAKSMPWLIDIADHGYEPEYIKKTVLSEATNILGTAIRENQFNICFSISTNQNELNINTKISKSTANSSVNNLSDINVSAGEESIESTSYKFKMA